MANIGKLTVSLTTLSGKFGDGFREAGKHLKEFGARAHELGAKVSEVGKKLLEFGGIAEAVSLGGIAYLTHEAAEQIEKTGHLADSLGTTTEALLGMQYAAKHAGVGADEFGQSMRHLEKELGMPTKEVSDALTKIGLSAVALNGQDAAKQFDRIARGIGALGTQSEKAAVAAELFGRQGVQLISIFDDYEGIDAYVDRVRKLGGAFSNVDAAQVREANHALEDMHAVFDAIFTKLAVKFAPFITTIADKFISLGTDGTSVADAIGNAFIDVARKMLKLVNLVNLAKSAFYGLGGAALKVAEYSYRFAAIADKTVQYVAQGVMGAVGANVKLPGIDDQVRNLGVKADELSQLSSRAFDAAGDYGKSALSGERSMAAQKAFDDLIANAHKRAGDKVGEHNEKRSANSAAERKRIGEEIAKGFTSILSRSGKFLDQRLGAARGAQLINGHIHDFLAFMKTLPMRALKAGWRPPMDLQTSVRGSFSGDTAGRMSATYSIQQKQLEESKKQTELWEQLLAQFQAGVVAP